jgi:hypothetical protein
LKELTPTFFPGNKRNALIDNYIEKNLKINGENGLLCALGGGGGGGKQGMFNTRKKKLKFGFKK